MTRLDLFSEAFRALAAHRLRASLSSIGIVFGVATVVAALAIGDGARREAVNEIGALGINNIFVRAVRPAGAVPASGSAAKQEPPAPELTVDDARRLAALPGVAAVSSVRTARTEVVAPQGRPQPATLAGVMPSWSQIANPQLAAGRWLVDRDVREARRVAIVGGALAKRLFGDAPPLGARVSAGGQWFQVVGVLTASGSDAARAKPSPIARIVADASVFVPVTAMDVRLGAGDETARVEEIAIAAAGATLVPSVAAAADALMRRHHRDAGTWELVVPRTLLDARLKAERVFNAVLMGIGGLALLISGIGIMNIMLASVAERTQEIGVRRAFGARATEVIAQFAVEAALLAMGGGIVGVPTGALLASLVALFAGWPVSISAVSVVIALTVAVATGLSFGVYPARVAARIQPIDALRAP